MPHAEVYRPARGGRGGRAARRPMSRWNPAPIMGGRRPAPMRCSHAGVARVVAAMADPDPRVAGRGLERLRAGGVDVDSRGCGRPKPAPSTPPSSSTALTGLPWVVLKTAMTLDGKIATAHRRLAMDHVADLPPGRPPAAAGPLRRDSHRRRNRPGRRPLPDHTPDAQNGPQSPARHRGQPRPDPAGRHRSCGWPPRTARPSSPRRRMPIMTGKRRCASADAKSSSARPDAGRAARQTCPICWRAWELGATSSVFL